MFLPVLTIEGAVKLPEKEQTTCYDEEGNVIPCTDTGQGSDIQAGVAWALDLYGINSGPDALTGLHKNSGLAYVWPVSAGNSAINPDIKANDSDGPITIFYPDSLSVTVSLDYESSQETIGNWWVAALTPLGWYYYDVASTSWSSAGNSYTGLSATYRGALFDLGPYSVVNLASLSGGNYTFYFAIDTNKKGPLDLDQLYYDSVNVNIIQVDSMIITPNDFKLTLDGEIELKIQVFGVAGNHLLYTDAFPIVVSWKSSNESVASVDEEGVVRGVRFGSAYITATTGDIRKSAKVIVESSSMASISLSPSRLSLDIGEVREFDVEALSSFGSPTTLDCTGGGIDYDSAFISAEFKDVQDAEKVVVEGIQSGNSLLTLNCGSSLVWTSSIDELIGTGVSFTKSNLSVGTHTITLTATDSDGSTGTDSVSITIKGTPTATITSPSNSSTYDEGDSITFSGAGTDPDDGDLSGLSLVWTSSNDEHVGTGTSFTKSDLSVGTHTITLTATDSDGLTGTDSVSITINTLTTTITSPSYNSTNAEGDSVTFSGTGTGPEDGNLSDNSLVWTSNSNGLMETGTDSVSITIKGTPTATITSPSNNSTYAEGNSVTFSGTGTDPDDGDLSVDFSSSPVVIQVKPPVTLPKPSDNYDFGIQPDLEVNGNHIYISSYDQVSKKLILTYFQTVWSSETLVGNGSYGKFSHTIIDPLSGDNPFVCALEETYLTCWNFNSRGFWDKHQVDEIASSFDSFDGRISAVANKDGDIRVLYTSEEGSLKMAESSLSSRDDWSISGVVGSNVSYIDSVVAPDGLPRIAFQFGDEVYYGVLGSNGQWSFQLIDDSTGDPTGIRLALGDNNRPQVIYYKNGNLVNAEKTDNTWWNSVITPVNTGENYSFGFGLNRHSLPRVSYYDADADTLKYAYKLASDRLSSSSRWRFDNPSSGTSIGTYSKLVVDEYQRAQIVYYNSVDKQVEYYVGPYLLDYTETNVSDDEDVSNLDISSGTCTFSIDPTSEELGPSGDTGSVSVIASVGVCSWTATSNDDWITVVSGDSGAGAGTVNYSISAIGSTEDRTGTMTIAGKTFEVTQRSCTYSLSSTGKTFDSSSGTGNVSVTASVGVCSWTAISNDDWITISSGTSGTGDGTVKYSISAIDSTVARTGTMTIAGGTFTITQTGCTYTLSSTGKTFDSSGGTGSVSITAFTSTCSWTAASNDDWITISSGTSGTGDGTVKYSISAIDSTVARTGTMTIAGGTFTITQTGCTYTLSSTTKAFTSSSGAGSVSVTTSTSGCSWTATSNDAWITIDSGSSGTGDGTVTYSVSANAGASRTGTITIAGETFTVSQDAI